MKRFKYIFRFIYAVILINLTTLSAYSQILQGGKSTYQEQKGHDSIEISLLTCSPGQEIWAQYGHTAIRIEDKSKGIDMVVNYGMFSSRQPYFIPRFVFGLTDYKVDAQAFDDFCTEYTLEGRGVVQQKLNITENDKQKILRAIADNLLPEHQTYRYNFFYDNCTSRARDILADNLQGKIIYPKAMDEDCSFRDMIHFWNKDFPWIQTGEDLLLGIHADWKTTKGEQQFIPDNLRKDFANATYNGHPLVKETTQLIEPQATISGSGFPVSPIGCGIIMLLISIIVCCLEYHKKVIYWGWDIFLMTISGLIGIVLTLMIFSQHPCVSLNLILLVFNPLPLVFAYPAIRHTRNHQKYNWWKYWGILLILGIIGALFQKEPALITIMALCLLIRTLVHIYYKR